MAQKKTKQAASTPRDDTSVVTPAVPSDKPELSILQLLRRIIRAVDINSRRLALRHGITGPQLVCLSTLCDEGPMTSADLSRKVFVSASTITGIIDRLEKQGYVKRHRNVVDRRRVLLHPTDEGIRLVLRAPSPLQDQLLNRLTNLPNIEQAAIMLSLQRVVDLLEAQQLDASPMLATGDLESKPANEADPD